MLRSCPADFPNRVIHGGRFAAMADVEINRNAAGSRFERGKEQLGRGAKIVFVKTDFVPEVFASLQQISNPEPFILITHNSDYPITRRLFESAPRCVRGWYALNVDHQAPNLIPIPSGMEQPNGGGYSADYSTVQRAWAANPKGDRTHTAFGCWNTKTNIAQRLPIRKLFEGRPGVVWRQHGISHLDFLQLCGRSRFVISPPGNGIDCHRTWEAMYMGAIPLVSRSSHTGGFRDLPMVMVDDWNGLTDERLSQIYEQYSKTAWDPERLFFQYWATMIREDAGTL